MFFKTIIVVISILRSLAQIEISKIKGDGSIFYFSSKSSPMHRINFFSKKETIKIEPSPFPSGKEGIWQEMKLKKYRG